jgi:caffeoyl-CoA O-methyltransferase
MKDRSDAILRAEQASYLEALEPPRDPLLAKMEQYARERGQPISDPEVAAFLAITARASGAKSIVELGTNIGYGAIVLARAAGPLAKVVTIELSHEMCTIARANVEEAGLAERIEVRQGAATTELEKIKDPIDLVYIDCVKEEYPRYLELAIPRLAPRGVLVADNVLWKGLVAHQQVPTNEAVRVEALRAFNLALMGNPLLRGTVLALGDGVAYAVKLGAA